MKDLSYRIILRPESEGGFTLTAPALPGCVTFGDTLEEAKDMANDAICAYLESQRKHAERCWNLWSQFRSLCLKRLRCLQGYHQNLGKKRVCFRP